jgi:hypothetical protein
LAAQNCQQELARMRTQLADALKPAGAATPEQLPGNQANLSDARVPADTPPTAEEFVRGQLNPSLERELDPELQRILGSKPNRWHALQCRGAICRMELTTFADDQSWMQELQDDESLRKYTNSISLKVGSPKLDPGSDKWLAQSSVLIRVHQ